MARTINVIPGPKARDGECVLWEKDNPEPGMEIYLAKAHKGGKQKHAAVMRTPLVSQKLALEILTEGTGDGGVTEPLNSEDESPLLPEPEMAPTPLAAELESGQSDSPDAGKLDFLTAKQRESLASAGLRSDEEILTATDEELDKVDGIGDATIKGIREAGKE